MHKIATSQFSGKFVLKETKLPPYGLPAEVIICPTMNRWGELGDGALPRMLKSVSESLQGSGFGISSDGAMLVISDASAIGQDAPGRLQGLERSFCGAAPLPTFIITSDLQKQVADMVRERTGLDRDVVEAILLETGYASQRVKLDVLLGGLVLAERQPKKILQLDDDTVVPEERICVRESVLTAYKCAPAINSQLIVHESLFKEEWTKTFGINRLEPFFEFLGLQIASIRSQQVPDLRCTWDWHDTMHKTLENITPAQPAQFIVDSGDQDMSGAYQEQAEVVAACGTKHHIPDYRTVRIAEQAVLNEFPKEEVPFISIPAGENRPFAFHRCETNVDSAALSRWFNEDTLRWPWWFVSSVAISRENALQTVTGHYRADNELLPVLLDRIREITGRVYVYLAGIETQIEHHRQRSGYRPDIIEQATASLVGNIAALEAARRLRCKPEGDFYLALGDVTENYQAPLEHVQRVMGELRNIADICEAKLRELKNRNGDHNDTPHKIEKYCTLLEVLHRKTAGFNFPVFYKHINTEVRDQLRFFARVVDALPIVLETVRALIEEGKYPVLEVKGTSSHLSV